QLAAKNPSKIHKSLWPGRVRFAAGLIQILGATYKALLPRERTTKVKPVRSVAKVFFVAYRLWGIRENRIENSGTQNVAWNNHPSPFLVSCITFSVLCLNLSFLVFFLRRNYEQRSSRTLQSRRKCWHHHPQPSGKL